MYTLVKKLPIRQVLVEQLPALVAAAIIAEVFYKFHSFLLECGAFLLTWFAIDGLLQWVKRLVAPRRPPGAQDASH